MLEYDLAIIGAGWAGFNAALKAKELGLKVCLIEKEQIGGTCLNSGCIPTKALIQSAKTYNTITKSANFGIETQSVNLNFKKIQERKDKIVQQLRSGMQFMLKGIDFINEEAEVLPNQEIKIQGKIIRAKSVLIACGSRPAELPNFKFDHKKIISSDDLLNIKEIPSTLLIIGGGIVGCEFASLFASLGTRVAIIEKMPQLLPGMDAEIAKKIENIFKKKGIMVITSGDALAANFNDYDLVLLCVGRKPNTLGVDLSVDDYLRTKQPNIFAAGDCTAKIMLAHYAAYQGEIAAHNIANLGKLKKADNRNIPNCIFTDPEIASIGPSEEELKSQGFDVKTYKFDFMASGMARIMEETEGFIKIISNNKTDEVLSASIIGPKATELIAILTVAVSNRLKIAQIRDTILAHPTLSEAISGALK